MMQEGVVSVVCEFCKTERRYDAMALAELGHDLSASGRMLQ